MGEGARQSLEWLAARIDALNRSIGRAASFLYLFLITVVLAVVILRYAFSVTFAWMEEAQWYLFAVAVVLAFGYAYADDAHVRVDPFRERLGHRGQAWIEASGVLFLLFPFCALLAWFAWDYFWASWTIREGSPQFSGLPARWAVKLVLFLSFPLMLLQGLAALLRAGLILTAPNRPGSAHVGE